jgi:hypothetical protein
MSCCFPGMDPFLESEEWEDFHTTFNTVVREVLAPRIEPRYLVRVERRVYVLPMPEEKRETYLVIRSRETREVVTVVESLSPGNKRRASDGRREYLRKREEVLQSPTHLVELDLLLGGERLPTITPLPWADYYAIVSLGEPRPRADVYGWTLQDPLPTIPIPLKKGDTDVPLDLQAVFTTVYDRARYDLSIDYAQPLDLPLPEADRQWLLQRIGGQRA